MAQHRLGIIMNGVTGRMGMNQHLIRSVLAIRAQGGVALKNGDRVMPDPILVGRNESRLAQLAKSHGIARWTTKLDAALKNPEDTLFFDAATTKLRAKLLHKAIAAGKDIYCEKPIAENLRDALAVARAAKKAGVRNGVVHLHGIITTDESRQAAIVAAENTAGVAKVHDHLCLVDSYSGFYVESPDDMKAAS